MSNFERSEAGKHPGVVWLEHRVVELKRRRSYLLSLQGPSLEVERARLETAIEALQAELFNLDAKAATATADAAAVDTEISKWTTLLESARSSPSVAQAIMLSRELQRIGGVS